MALSTVVIAAVPVAMIGNALCLLLGPWLVDVEYALPGFPDDPGGLTKREREDLAREGLDSIRPFGGGETMLREARVPDGQRSFVDREVTHMEDVRALVAAVLVGSAPRADGSDRGRGGASAPGRLGEGRGGARLRGEADAGHDGADRRVMLIGFESLFDGFHGVFFEGDTWRSTRLTHCAASIPLLGRSRRGDGRARRHAGRRRHPRVARQALIRRRAAA